MPESGAVDTYLATLPDDRRAWMQTLRETIRAAAPDAVEVITYKMPGFKQNGTFLVSYDAYKRHYSLFPASDPVLEAGGDELAPFVKGRGTISFPIDMPVPVELVTRIIRARVAEHEARARAESS
ncbi:MAG: hypothetical protein EPO36_06800 [Chloroflexota bacterium]|nr:MAG: hypothetical protein EPO36_06800 [Chloroflexota bacterium]